MEYRRSEIVGVKSAIALSYKGPRSQRFVAGRMANLLSHSFDRPILQMPQQTFSAKYRGLPAVLTCV